MPASLAIGFVTAIASNYATGIKVLLKVRCLLLLSLISVLKPLPQIDDAVDTFALHGIGGFVYVLDCLRSKVRGPSKLTRLVVSGAILTALFADERVTSFDPAAAGAGWINHNYIALGYNLAGAVTIMACESKFDISSFCRSRLSAPRLRRLRTHMAD